MRLPWSRRRVKRPFPPQTPGIRCPVVSYGKWGEWLVCLTADGTTNLLTPDAADALAADLQNAAVVVRLLQAGRPQEAAAAASEHRQRPGR